MYFRDFLKSRYFLALNAGGKNYDSEIKKLIEKMGRLKSLRK